MAKHKFTPTQDLILDVLLARHRLGEGFWTFDSRNMQSLVSLMDQGYVVVMDGNVENTIRAMLTDKGRMEFVSNYQSPLEKKLKFQEDMVLILAREAEDLRQQWVAEHLEASRPQH